MAKGRSDKLIVATLRGSRKALQGDLHHHWMVVSSYHWRMKLAALAEQAVDSGNDSAFRNFAKKHDANITIEDAAKQSKDWRSTIFDLTATCVDRVMIEASAPKDDDAGKLLGTIARAADELAKAIAKAQGGELGALIGSDIESRLLCREVEQHKRMLQYAHDYPQVPMSAMLRHARDYAQAAQSAKESLADDDFTVVEGQAWDGWIATLLKFAKGNGFPATVSPDSAFVQFVEVLQKAFTAELSRASASMRLADKDRARLNDEIARHRTLSEGGAKGNGNLMRSIARGIENANQRATAQAEKRRLAEAEREADEIAKREKMATKARGRRSRRQAPRHQAPGAACI